MSWEDTDFDSNQPKTPAVTTKAWDEEENWEASWEKRVEPKPASEQKPPPQKQAPKPVIPEKKEPEKPLTSEERSQLKKDAEKQAKLADFDNAVELFKGVDDSNKKTLAEEQIEILTKFEPFNASDFGKLAAAIGTRTKKFEESLHYPQLVKDICKSLCLSDKMNSSDCSEIVKALNIIVNDKIKAEKAPKKGMKKTAAKKKVASTTAAKSFDLEDENEDGGGASASAGGSGDYDDFM